MKYLLLKLMLSSRIGKITFILYCYLAFYFIGAILGISLMFNMVADWKILKVFQYVSTITYILSCLYHKSLLLHNKSCTFLRRKYCPMNGVDHTKADPVQLWKLCCK